MSILVPKAHRDGSQLGMHKREWSNILSQNLYSSSSFINGAEITSGSAGLLVDGRPIITSPFLATSISSELTTGIVGLRLNNLMKSTADYNMDGNTLTNVRTPVAAGEVATKYYVDQNIQGIKWKQSTRISSQLENAGTGYWTERTGTLKFTETGPNTDVYQLTSGNEGWVYDHSNGTLRWEPPTSIQYVNDTASTGSTPAGSSLNNTDTYSPMSVNHPYTFSTADTSDTTTSAVTINFKQSLFDGGTGGNAYGDIEIGDRVLIKDASPKRINGIWEFAETGSNPATWSSGDGEVTRWSLKRPLDFDLSREVSAAAVFVEEGHNNEDSSFVVTTNDSSIGTSILGTYDLEWSLFGTQQADNITVYKDASQANRFEVTGVLRDINDIFYDYNSSPSVRLDVGDGQFLVGNGTTFVAESGNTVRTSMGLGTGDSPTFTNLTLTGGTLKATKLESNTASPLELASDLSGTVDLSVKDIDLDGSLTANSIVSTTSITAGTTITSTGLLTAGNGLIVSSGNLSVNNGNISANNGSISSQFVTASVALSASYIQLREFSNVTNFTTTNGYPTQNSLYVANNTLYFDGTAIGGAGGSGQPVENVLYYGGNLVSDTATAANQDHSTTALYMRIGVSGSHLSTSTDAAGTAAHYQILTGSFQELTGTKVDINGGLIDGTVIGGTTSAAGTFTTLDATTLTAGTADINGGTIDGTVIGDTAPVAGTFTTLNATTGAITNLTATSATISGGTGTFSSLTASNADINGGNIDGTIIGANSPAQGTFDSLTVVSNTTFNADNVNITGGFLDYVTIGSNSTIEATTIDYGTGSFHTINATDIVVPKSGEAGNIDITISDTSSPSKIEKIGGAILNITASAGVFDTGTFTTLTASNADINGGTIDGTIIGDTVPSLGTFTELTAGTVDINGGTLDNINIGISDATSENNARFKYLTGSLAYIGNPAAGEENSYDSYGRFLTLSASHVEIIDPDSQNSGTFEYLSGSYIGIKNALTASNPATIDFGGNAVQNISMPGTSEGQRNHAVSRAYIDTVVGIKTSVRVAWGNSIDITTDASSDPQDTIDNVPLNLGDRILLTGQSTASQNGIWEVRNGPLVRPFDYKTGDPAGGYIVLVEEGNSNLQSIYSLKSSGVIDTADVVATKVSSKFGVSTDGKGLKKTGNIFDVDINEGNWDDNSWEDRASLIFNGTDGSRSNQLVLSSSIRVNELKVSDSSGGTGKVLISGSNDSYIDNVNIGINTPAAGKFASLDLTGNITLGSASEVTSSAGVHNTKIGLHEGTFNKLTIPDTLVVDNTSASGEDLIVISGSLKIDNTAPNNKVQRLWRRPETGDLYYENEKIGSAGGTSVGNVTSTRDFTSLFVTGSQSDGHGAYISGTLVVEGDVQIKGTTTTISSSNTTFQDSIIGLGITGSDASTETFNNLGDRGLIFARSANQTDALPGMWWDGAKFNFAKSVTSPSSGSFGAVTERSTIYAGNLQATEVTASVGLKINGYNFPTSDGNPNQVISTDGSGNLSFVNQTDGSSTLSKLDITFVATSVQTVATNWYNFDANSANPDMILLDVSNNTNNDWTGNNDTKYLSARLNNLNASFFSENKTFYVGLYGFDYDNYQNSNNPPETINIGLSFNGTQLSSNNVAVLNSTVDAQYVTQARFNSWFMNNKLNANDSNKVYSGIRYFFTGGSGLEVHDSAILDRCQTDTDTFMAFKFTWLKDASNKLILHTNFDDMIIFSKNDSRFV